MTAESAIESIRLELRQIGGEMVGSVISPALVIKYLNMGANLITQETRCLKGVQSLSTTSGDDYYTITAMMDITSVVYDDNRLIAISEALTNKIDDDPGTPLYYNFEEPNRIRFYPIPNAAKTVWIFGYKWPTAVSSSGDSIDLPTGLADLCIDYALWRCTRIVQPELAGEMYAMWRSQLDEYKRSARRRAPDTQHDVEDEFFGAQGEFVGTNWIKLED